MLKLEVEPPPGPPAPAPIVVAAPVLPAVALPAAAIPAAPKAARTGKRARALARCKTKKTHKARQACKKRARKMPL